MSRRGLRLFALGAMCATFTCWGGTALAQQTYGPVLDDEDEAEAAAPVSQTRQARQCDTQPQDDGVILVCRDLGDDEAYRSPLPAPTASDRTIIPGLTDPPCWVTNPSAVGTPGCMRFGSVPPPAIIVDLTQFPEPLDDASAAAVSRVPEEELEGALPAPNGERIPIDLSDD